MKIKLMSLCVMLTVAQQSCAMGNWQNWREQLPSWPTWTPSLPSANTLARTAGVGAATVAPAVISQTQMGQNYCPYSLFAPGVLAAAAGAWLNRDAGTQGALMGAARWSMLPLVMAYYLNQQRIAEQAAEQQRLEGGSLEKITQEKEQKRNELIKDYKKQSWDLALQIDQIAKSFNAKIDLHKAYEDLQGLYLSTLRTLDDDVVKPWVYVVAAIVARLIIQYQPELVKSYNVNQDDLRDIAEKVNHIRITPKTKAAVDEVLTRANLGALSTKIQFATNKDLQDLVKKVAVMLDYANEPKNYIQDLKIALVNTRQAYDDLYKAILNDNLLMPKVAHVYQEFKKGINILLNYSERWKINPNEDRQLFTDVNSWLGVSPVISAYAMFVHKYQPSIKSYVKVVEETNTNILGVLKYAKGSALEKDLIKLITVDLKNPSFDIQTQISILLEGFPTK